jgi:hypothetical protein
MWYVHLLYLIRLSGGWAVSSGGLLTIPTKYQQHEWKTTWVIVRPAMVPPRIWPVVRIHINVLTRYVNGTLVHDVDYLCIFTIKRILSVIFWSDSTLILRWSICLFYHNRCHCCHQSWLTHQTRTMITMYPVGWSVMGIRLFWILAWEALLV